MKKSQINRRSLIQENTEQAVTPAKAGVQLVDFHGFRPSPE